MGTNRCLAHLSDILELRYQTEKSGRDMEKIAMLGVMAVMLALPLKKDKSEYSMLLILVACLMIGILALVQIREVLDFIVKLESYLGENKVYVTILLKMVGITYVAEFGANICRDAGYGAVADQIAFYGKLMLLAVSMPILNALFDLLAKL